MFTLFWIAILATIIIFAMRRYRASNRGQNGSGPDSLPGQPFGRFPGGVPGSQNSQPRDGYTQQDYYGGFGQLGAPKQPGPANGQYPDPQYPGQQYPGPAGYQSPVPYEDSPEYLNNPPQPQRPEPAPAPGQPQTPQPPSAGQGYRARKLAELDQQYTDGRLSMEDYMAQRAEIMKG